MALTGTTALAADLQTYLSAKLLPHAEVNTVMKQFGALHTIPSASSKTISFTQYAKLTPVSGTLTEGTTPTENALTATAVTATVDQIGDYIILTDLAELTVKHPVVQESLRILGMQAGESVDKRIQTTLVAGTNVNYAGSGNAARADLADNDVITTDNLLYAKTQLKLAGAQPFDGGLYVLIVDPSVEADIVTDPVFIAAHEYENHTPLYQGEVGKWMGFRVVVSNNIATISSTAVVHTSYAIGRNAYAVTDLQTMRTYMEGPGGITDPLHQRRTLGWKCSFKTVITNQAWIRRIESTSDFD